MAVPPRKLAVATAYLATYNVSQTACWCYVLFVATSLFLKTSQLGLVYPATSFALRLCQGLAFLEILHAALGIVKGSAAMAFMQWSGRSHVLFAALQCIPELWQTPAAGLMVIVWAAIEVIRYPWYTATLLDSCPYALTWLRYTAFIPLYPIGVLCELRLLYVGLPFMIRRSLHCIFLPNVYNFGFYYPWFVKGLMTIYPLLWLQLYMFMFKQRRHKLDIKVKTT